MGITATRSTALKVLDKAIETYGKAPTDANAYKIADALTQWDKSRGLNAAVSGRDKQGAVAALRVQLASAGISADGYRAANFSPAEIAALKFQSEERRKVLNMVFEHSDVVFVGRKPELNTSLAKLQRLAAQKKAASLVHGEMKSHSHSGGGQGSSSSSSSGGLGGTLNSVIAELKAAFTKLVSECFEIVIANFDEIATKLVGIGEYILRIVKDVIGTVAPFVGHIMDAKSMIMGWAKVAMDANTMYDIGKRAYVIDFGAPTAAFEALLGCMDNEIRQNMLIAGNATLSFAAKTGAAFLDGGAATGTAIGIVSALAEFARQLYQLASEWKATKKVKEALRGHQPLDLSIFKTYPLMGCYMLTSATLSDIIPLDCFGTPGWMDVIEQRKKNDVDMILAKAEKLIQASPFEFTNLPKKKREGTERNVKGFASSLISPVIRKL